MQHPTTPAPTVIYTDEVVTVTVSATASAQAVALLQQTTYGTSGPRYRHTDQETKVNRIISPYFFDLRVGNKVVGTYCLSRRLVQLPAGQVPAFYGRYLAIDPAHAGHGYGSRLKAEAVRYVERTTALPYLFYSYIEAANSRSVRISEKEGFTSVAQLEALAFSRLYPRPDPRMSRLPAAEVGALRTKLDTAYRAYACVQFERVYEGQNYFVLRENGEIIAGVQANPVRWRIVQMPGLSGWLLLHVLPHLPVLKRLLNPHNYQFVALEAVYTKPGREQEIWPLLESVLAHFRYTSALLMLDVHAPLRQQLVGAGKLGLLNSLKKNIYTHVMVRSHGLTEHDIKQTPEQPLYTSAFDYT